MEAIRESRSAAPASPEATSQMRYVFFSHQWTGFNEPDASNEQ